VSEAMLEGLGASFWLLATGRSRCSEIPGFAPRRHRRFALYSELPGALYKQNRCLICKLNHGNTCRIYVVRFFRLIMHDFVLIARG